MIHIAGEVVFLPQNASLPVTLKSKEYQVFTVVPVKELECGARFAPIGLVKMFNSGGAIKELNYETSNGTVALKARGCGLFGAFSSARPKRVLVDLEEAEFSYEEGRGLLALTLPVAKEEMYQWSIVIDL